MQILIIGASGFIGRNLFEYCKMNDICVVGTYYSKKTYDEYIFFDMYQQTFSDLQKRLPESINVNEVVVVLCSANASIDSCKMNEALSYKLNVQKTKALLDELEQLKIKTVFLSSEAVFDGKKGLYLEEDIPNPNTVYGRQKYEIENYILDKLHDTLIFRISRAVGSCYGENDIFNEFYEKMRNNEKILCLRNQSFCLTEVGDISRAIILSLEKGLSGIYNISSENYVTRYDLAILFAKSIFHREGMIEEKGFEELGFKDNRHIKGGLDGTKLRTILNMDYVDLNTIIEKYKSTIPTNT